MRKPEDFHGEKTFSGAAVSDFLPVGFLDAPTPTQGEMALYINNAWFLLRKMSQEAIVEWSTIRLMVKWRQIQCWRVINNIISGLITTPAEADKQIGELTEEIYTAGNLLVFKTLCPLENATDEKIAYVSKLVATMAHPDKEKLIEAQDQLNGLTSLFQSLEATSRGIYDVHRQTVENEKRERELYEELKRRKKHEKSNRRRERQMRNGQEPIQGVDIRPIPGLAELQARIAAGQEPAAPSAPQDNPPHVLWKPLKTSGIPDPSKER